MLTLNRTIIACEVTSIYEGEFFLRNNLMHCRYEHRLDLVNSRTRLEADTDIRFCLAQKDLGMKGSKIQNASKTVKAEDIICILLRLFSGYVNNRV